MSIKRGWKEKRREKVTESGGMKKKENQKGNGLW